MKRPIGVHGPKPCPWPTPSSIPRWRRWQPGGIPPPDVGFELGGPDGEVVAEAELAWETERGAVLLAPEAHQPFAEAGWRTFPADATDLTDAILAWWAEIRA